MDLKDQPIKELNLEHILPNSNTLNAKNYDDDGMKIVVIGKPGTGKSMLIRDLMYHKKHIIPVAQVYSGTEDSTRFYAEIVPDTFIFDELDETKLQDFIKRQKFVKRAAEFSDTNPWSMLIIDDCADDPRKFATPVMKQLFKNGRHYRFLLILAIQYCFDVKPWLRATVDGTFIFQTAAKTDRQKIYNNYASQIGNFELFCKYMDQITQDYTALYIDNKSAHTNPLDSVYFYRACVHDEVPFGSVDLWNSYFQRVDPDYTASVR